MSQRVNWQGGLSNFKGMTSRYATVADSGTATLMPRHEGHVGEKTTVKMTLIAQRSLLQW